MRWVIEVWPLRLVVDFMATYLFIEYMSCCTGLHGQGRSYRLRKCVFVR